MIRKIVCTLVIVGFSIYGQKSTIEGCSSLSSADFSIEELINKNGTNGAEQVSNLNEPVAFDVVTYGSGEASNTLVYFVERGGAVKRFDVRTKNVSSVGNISVWGQADNGLMGIALDPDFKTNNTLYFWYALPNLSGSNRQLRLSRFQLTNTGLLNNNSRFDLLSVLASDTDQWHSGGGMVFDSYGDLWLSIGNNSKDHDNNSQGGYSHFSATDSTTSDEWGASNTANLRGSILRIHPDASVPKGYTIPDGNFGEYWADEFEKQGKPSSLVAEYRNTTKVLPEIYTKGHRSNFHIGVHPTKRWLGWGEVNFQSRLDEFNIVANPVFAGYPYFHGNQAKTAGYQSTYGVDVQVATPKNLSPLNSGVQDLPPAYKPDIVDLHKSGGASHMAGPIYAFDSTNVSRKKFPPHFDNHWFLFETMAGKMWVSEVNDGATLSNTKELGGSAGLFKNIALRKPLYAQFAGDGTMILLNYGGFYNSNENPGFSRISYTGSCYVYKESISSTAFTWDPKVELIGNQFAITESVPHKIELLTVLGQRVWKANNTEAQTYDLERIQNSLNLEKGLYLVSVSIGREQIIRKVSLF